MHCYLMQLQWHLSRTRTFSSCDKIRTWGWAVTNSEYFPPIYVPHVSQLFLGRVGAQISFTKLTFFLVSDFLLRLVFTIRHYQCYLTPILVIWNSHWSAKSIEMPMLGVWNTISWEIRQTKSASPEYFQILPRWEYFL